MGRELSPEEFIEAIQKVTTPLPGSRPLPIEYKLAVKQRYDGYDLLTFLSKALPRVPPEDWVCKIKTKKLLLEGKPAIVKSIVRGGNIIQHHSVPKVEPYVSTAITLIYQDENIMVINKPAPLPMHPSGRFNKNSLTEILKLAFPGQVYKLIHRLDANTTGLIVLGKNQESLITIGRQFESNTIKKEYLALVEGLPMEDAFMSKEPISLKKVASGSREVVSDGAEAFTEFEVLQRRKKSNTTLLRVIPHTGRTNQIRVHLANLGFPIVGDIGYKNAYYFNENPLTYPNDSLYLHAWKFMFMLNNRSIFFEAPIPLKFNIVEK